MKKEEPVKESQQPPPPPIQKPADIKPEPPKPIQAESAAPIDSSPAPSIQSSAANPDGFHVFQPSELDRLKLMHRRMLDGDYPLPNEQFYEVTAKMGLLKLSRDKKSCYWDLDGIDYDRYAYLCRIFQLPAKSPASSHI